jgi:hypothetical protein
MSQFPTWLMAGQAASRDFAGLLHVFPHPPLVRFPTATRLGFVVRSTMRSKSGRGWRLFFGANRRQAASFRQCWMAREMLGLPLVF